MRLCDYGCGKEAKHPFKNGKWCCEEKTNKCSAVKQKQIISRKGQIPWNKGKTGVYSKESLKKMRKSNTGKNNPSYGKKRTKIQIKRMKKSQEGHIVTTETRNKISLANMGNTHTEEYKRSLKITFKQLQERYPFFCQVEGIKEGPEPGKFFVHCKNHNCFNSKEKDGYFLTNYDQLYERIRALENNDGNDGQFLYCSEQCKQECPSFNLISDPCKNTEKPYTNEEYQTFRQFVLERDNYICQFCGKPAEHVHHERPQKLEPYFALDPDLAWSCCKKCHYKYGHKIGTPCSTGNLANKIC